MAAVNSVQNGLHLPLTGIAPPRVLMCSASMGAEGSVTLQLREAVQAPDTPNSLDHTALTISGYPDPEILADVLGSLQAAALNNNNSNNNTVIGSTNNGITASCTTTTTTNINGINSNSNITIANNVSGSNTNNGTVVLNGIKTISTSSQQQQQQQHQQHHNHNHHQQQQQHHSIVNASNSSQIPNSFNTNSNNINNNKNNNNNSSNGANSNITNNSNNNNNNNNNNNSININNQQIINCSSSNSNSSTSSNISSNSSSNISSIINSDNSNNSISTAITATQQQHNNNNSNITATMLTTTSGGGGGVGSNGTTTGTLTTNQNSQTTTTGTTTTTIVVRKQRPKTSSPTRHGPQQCQVCSKIFGNASALAKHKLTHSDERKYVCAMCSKAFKRQDHLNGHMLTHRNKKPYECKAEGCGKSYCDARSLRRHTENHHSALAMTPTTPNQSLSPSTGPPTGLSLSPATASGDASSPHGANCVQYITNNNSDGNGGGSIVSNNSKPSSPSSPPGGNGNDGLTRQQLDLISQIMQQTKQASAQVTVSTNHNGIKNHQQSQQQQQLQHNQQQQQQNHQQQQQQQSQQQQTTQRPRTWNMQTQLQQQSKLSSTNQNGDTTQTLNGLTTATITSGGITINTTTGTTTVSQGNQTTTGTQQQQQQNQSTSTTPVGQIGHTLNIVKIEQKPVECNLCHRKFKNIPALNGHMRLHGGYFKKETETKKCEKKESNGPPLQTASIGVRALIEEKIISKRCKDLKGAFVVPAPPLSTTVRRASEIENSFLTPKNPMLNNNNNNNSNNTTATISLNNATLTTPTNQISNGTTVTNNQNVQIHATTLQLQKQTLQKITSISTISQGTSTESKDATLIELLKRGTKVAVKRTCSDPGQIFNTTNGTQTIVLPASSISAVSNQNNQITTNLVANTPTSSSDVSISAQNSINTTSRSPLSISLPNGETAPLALTISQAPNGAGDVYTLTYSTDSSSTFFSDSDVYSVSDTAMLLQAVDSIQLLNDSTGTDQLNQITSIADLQHLLKKEPTEQLATDDNSNVTLTSNGGGSIGGCVEEYTMSNSKQIQDVLNSPLPDSIAEFSTFHSKDFVLYNCGSNGNPTTTPQNSNSNSSNNTHCSAIGSPNTSSSSPLSSQHHHHQSQPPSVSPLPSPLAYPTPPASHEAITQSSPFLDDSHHFPDASAFFDDKSSVNFITDSTSQFFKDNSDADLTESEKILSIKNELFNESKSVLEAECGGGGATDTDDFETDVFDSHVKVEDLLNETTGDEQCDLKDFSDQNLSFLDEPENFLDDSRNPSSPLSESFFTSGIGTAEEVKEVLKDVLPSESLAETNVAENQCENDIDLYYLPGLTLQSQMMPNSDDPLLSSSPKDFGHHRIFLQQITPQHQIIQQQSNQPNQQQLIMQTIQPQQQQQLQKFDPIQLFTCTTSNVTNKNNKLNESTCIFPVNSTSSNIASVTVIGSNHNQQQLPTTYSAATVAAINNLQQNGALTSAVQQQQKDNNSIFLTNTNNLENFLNSSSSTSSTTSTTHSTLPTIINISSTSAQNLLNYQQQPKLLNTTGSATTLTIIPTSQNNFHITQQQPQQQQQNQQTSAQIIAQTSQITSSILKRRLRQGGSSVSGSGSVNFPKKQEVYRSKLRKPSSTHYTPAPILNPDRKGTGIYSNLPKSLVQETISLGDEFDDAASSLVAFLDDSKVNIGTAYQAQIPTCIPGKLKHEINNNYEFSNVLSSLAANIHHQQQQQNCNNNYNQQSLLTLSSSASSPTSASTSSTITSLDYDELMWDPNICENINSSCDDKTLNRFIDLTKSSAAPLGCHSEEVALKALLDANGFTHIAVLTLLQSPSNAVHLKWSANEIEAFLKGLEKFGKDFYRISNELKTKTTKECIQLYYFWKKLCVDYKITHLKQDTCDTSDETSSHMNSSHSNTEHRPYVCEMPDCSASFTSKAALHSHTRLHCIGRNHHYNNSNNNNNNNNNHNNNNNNNNNQNHNHNQIGTNTNNINNSLNNGNNNNNSNNSNSNTNNNVFQFNQQSNNNNNNNSNNNSNSNNNNNLHQITTATTTNVNSNRDDFPCKVCGKVFNKVKSRSAHMKSHRPQDNNDQLHNNNNNNNNNNYINNNTINSNISIKLNTNTITNFNNNNNNNNNTNISGNNLKKINDNRSHHHSHHNHHHHHYHNLHNNTNNNGNNIIVTTST